MSRNQVSCCPQRKNGSAVSMEKEGEMATKEQGQGASCSSISFGASSALSPLLSSSHSPSTGEPLTGTSLSFSPGR